MLDFVTYTQRDESRQTLRNFAASVGGSLLSVPAGDVAFAVGAEYRDHLGWFHPDPVAERGETAGIPAGRTEGQFDVTEVYGELNVPLLDRAGRYWELTLAARRSDYSTSGADVTYKASTLFRPLAGVSLRGSLSTGFRAPGIGELFGGAAREDFSFQDPCSDVLAQVGAAGGGRDAPQPQRIVDNCARLGVPVGFVQSNPQLSAVSGGNPSLDAEQSEGFTVGAAWRRDFEAGWIARLTASVDHYRVEIDKAVQGRSPADVLAACVDTLDPLFCDLAPRTSNGAPDVIDNQLQNIGGIEASGIDLLVTYDAPVRSIGSVGATLRATPRAIQESRECSWRR